MLLFIAVYLELGLIVMLVTACIHLYKAEHQGYEAIDYWDYVVQEATPDMTAVRFIKGLSIWPVRLIQFIAFIDVLYEIYEYRKSGPRIRKGRL